VYDLAIDKEFQRKGIGKQLIAAVNKHCREMGFEEVFVQADKVDEYALDFYRSTNTTEEEDVSHFYYTLNQKD
jgi:aminoglycoside 3-N-acetyltransferase I